MTMNKHRQKDIYKDLGEGYSSSSLDFAKNYVDQLKNATTVESIFKSDGRGDWATYNTRFTTPFGQEFWFSGLNCGYGGEGPRTLVKILKLIGWTVNPEVIYNEDNKHLKIARDLPPQKSDEEETNEEEK
jgi:hypothetical protein